MSEQLLIDLTQPKYNGPEYNPQQDQVRLSGQTKRIFNCMKDGVWRTYTEIQNITRDPVTSIASQLRHLRKTQFGKHQVLRRHRGDRKAGLYEYKLIVNPQIKINFK